MANRRIGGPEGGSDKGSGPGPGGGAVLVISVAVVVGAGGISATGGATVASSTSSVSGSSGARSGSRISDRDSQAAEARLVRHGVRVTARTTGDATDCVKHSYGHVQGFFRRQPCTALHRALFEIRDRKGDVVLVAVSWVQMPDEAGARALLELLDTNGSGNITELSREQGRYRTVRYTGAVYASHRNGTVVVNAQAQPVARGATGLALTSIVTNAVH